MPSERAISLIEDSIRQLEKAKSGPEKVRDPEFDGQSTVEGWQNESESHAKFYILLAQKFLADALLEVDKPAPFLSDAVRANQ
jgi:hypothetical protein